jgi:serine/threonine-protein kinase PpkA
MHGGIEPREALRLVAQIAEALDAIHARGIVHRDLKPANILLRPDARPVIVDFGLAKDLAAISTLTIGGQLLATPRYMSPEQCRGLEVDGRSDLYSLGVIFYEMLTGERMYETANAADLVNLQVNGPLPVLPEPLRVHQPLLDRLVAKKPEDRLQSARKLVALLSA